MLTHQFPCETNPADEGLAVVESGGGSVDVVLGSLSGVGDKYININANTKSKLAYLQKSGLTMEPGEVLAMSVYARINSTGLGARWFYIFTGYYNGIRIGTPYVGSTAFTFSAANLDSGDIGLSSFSIGQSFNDIFHFAVEIKRSSDAGVLDGYIKIFINGVLKKSVTGICTYSFLTNKSFIFNEIASVYGTLDLDIDDLRIGSSIEDVLPDGVTLPSPSDELPGRARTVVLFNQNNADSLAFAQSLDINEAMFCPLPCSSEESLSSYNDFQNEIENSLQSFFSFRPSVAAQATCIITGLNVPGYFWEGSDLYSTCNRLMNIDSEFTGIIANPLRGTSGRLTASILTASNMRMSARLDGSILDYAQALYALGNGVVEVSEGEKIFSTAVTSLAQEKLRLEIKSLAGSDVINDAIYYQHEAAEGWAFGEGGSRLAFITGLETDLMRSEISDGMNNWGYRAFINFLNKFDFNAFCAMLNAGGTIVEAFAVSIECLDAANQLASWPLMTADFPKAGYDVFLAQGDMSKIDFDSQSKCLHSGAAEFSLELPENNETYVLLLQKIDSYGQMDTRGRMMFLDNDGYGNYFQQLPQPFDLSATNFGQAIHLGLTCRVSQGQQKADNIKIFEYIAGSFDAENPLAVIPVEEDSPDEFFIDLDISRPVTLVAVAEDAFGNLGHHSWPLFLSELRKPVTPEPVEV